MSPLEKAAKALDEYAAHAAEEGQHGTIAVPVRFLQQLRKALAESK